MSMTEGKDAFLQIRLPTDLKAAFLRACQKNDLSAAQVLRHFIRAYVEDKQQLDLDFPGGSSRSV